MTTLPTDATSEGLAARLLMFALRCSADNPAAIGSRNKAIELLEGLGIEPRESGVFFHSEDADLADARRVLAQLAPPSAAPVGDLRPEVLAFAHLMEQQLRANDHKPGWKDELAMDLLPRIREETEELDEATVRLAKQIGWGDAALYLESSRQAVAREAADVANFAMMVADVCGTLPALQQSRSGAGHVRDYDDLLGTLIYVSTALPVLKTMLRSIDLSLGENKADEMIRMVQAALDRTDPQQAPSPVPVDAGGVNRAIATYNRVWEAAENITAQNVEQIRREAMIAALHAAPASTSLHKTQISPGPPAVGAGFCPECDFDGAHEMWCATGRKEAAMLAASENRHDG